jgi:hypothetical protein
VLIVAEAWIVNDVVSEETPHLHHTSLSIEARRLYSYLSISATFALFFPHPMPLLLDYLSITSFPIHPSSLRSVSTILCTITSFPLFCLRPIEHSCCICGDTMHLVYIIPCASYCSNNVSVLPPLECHDQQLMVTLLSSSGKRKLRI